MISGTTLGMILLGVAASEITLLGAMGFLKGKPILIVAGFVSGLVTGLIGLAYLLGKLTLA